MKPAKVGDAMTGVNVRGLNDAGNPFFLFRGMEAAGGTLCLMLTAVHVFGRGSQSGHLAGPGGSRPVPVALSIIEG